MKKRKKENVGLIGGGCKMMGEHLLRNVAERVSSWDFVSLREGGHCAER